MARAISYFVFSSSGSYLRWDDDLTINFRIRQYEMSITGGGGVDRLYVGPGTKVDAGALFASANTDELYFSGNFNDYTQTISPGGVYTFTGQPGVSATLSDNITSNPTVNISGLESGASWEYQLTFSDATLSAADQAAIITGLTQQGFLGWFNGSGNSLSLPDITGRLNYFSAHPNLATPEVFAMVGVPGHADRYNTGFPLSLSARQTDAAGNVSAGSAEVVMRYDRVAPITPEFTNVADGNPIKGFVVLESGAIRQYQVFPFSVEPPTPDPNGWINVSGSTFDLYSLGNGRWDILLTTIDLAGNRSDLINYGYTVTLPVLP